MKNYNLYPALKKKLQIIKEKVCEHYEISSVLVVKKCRNRNIVLARQTCMYLASKLTTASLGQIGAFYGNKDHATVLHSIKCIDNMCFCNSDFEDDIVRLREETHSDISCVVVKIENPYENSMKAFEQAVFHCCF